MRFSIAVITSADGNRRVNGSSQLPARTCRALQFRRNDDVNVVRNRASAALLPIATSFAQCYGECYGVRASRAPSGRNETIVVPAHKPGAAQNMPCTCGMHRLRACPTESSLLSLSTTLIS
jgi:hypothetical protein